MSVSLSMLRDGVYNEDGTRRSDEEINQIMDLGAKELYDLIVENSNLKYDRDYTLRWDYDYRRHEWVANSKQGVWLLIRDKETRYWYVKTPLGYAGHAQRTAREAKIHAQELYDTDAWVPYGYELRNS